MKCCVWGGEVLSTSLDRVDGLPCCLLASPGGGTECFCRGWPLSYEGGASAGRFHEAALGASHVVIMVGQQMEGGAGRRGRHLRRLVGIRRGSHQGNQGFDSADESRTG